MECVMFVSKVALSQGTFPGCTKKRIPLTLTANLCYKHMIFERVPNTHPDCRSRRDKHKWDKHLHLLLIKRRCTLTGLKEGERHVEGGNHAHSTVLC